MSLRDYVGASVMSHRRARSGVFRTSMLTGVGTVLFYLVAPQIPGAGSFVERYFCGHPLEYISTVMFFAGLTVLLQKYSGLRGERRALATAEAATQSNDEPAAEPATTEDRREQVFGLADELRQTLPATHVSIRLQETLHYLQGSRSDGLEGHLKYLAELAVDRLHQSYATIRTITWAIPIIGFLGTVIGITMAIANVTPEQLDSSLAEVTGGLAVAFDTTAQALGMSIVLVFASFAVERAEQNVLNEVEEFGIDRLLPRLSPAEDRESETTSSGVTETLLQQQSDVWLQQLAAMNGLWKSVLEQHTSDMRSALIQETERTLQQHREAAGEARDAYTAALRDSAGSIVQQTSTVLQTFEQRVSAWQEALQVSSAFSAQQSEALHQLGATLLKMTESEERLAHLQQQLNENLQALQLANTFEETANSLTAAVHVLTAKASSSLRVAA